MTYLSTVTMVIQGESREQFDALMSGFAERFPREWTYIAEPGALDGTTNRLEFSVENWPWLAKRIFGDQVDLRPEVEAVELLRDYAKVFCEDTETRNFGSFTRVGEREDDVEHIHWGLPAEIPNL